MKQEIIRTILTFDISDDETSTEINKLLKKLGYKDGKDQSTRIHSRSIRERTLAIINLFCKKYDHGFTSTDRFCFANPEYMVVENDRVPVIVHREYSYDPEKDEFN